MGRAGIEWMAVPGGSFEMGEAAGESDEQPVHTVIVASFEMSRSEVTVGQYRACVGAGACTPPRDRTSSDSCNWGHTGREDHPVNCLNWEQAVAFATWAGGRLPSEAEWEYAARSGAKGWPAPWGTAPPSCTRAVFREDGEDGCGLGHSAPVCSRPAGNSVHGVCDLLGSMYEWVADTWHETYEGAPTDGSAWVDDPYYRVRRGRGWFDEGANLRVADRYRDLATDQNSGVGVRLVR